MENMVLNYREKAKHINDRTYTDYYYRLMLIARSVFEWKGLPNGIDEKWIERYLYHQGCCMFYYDDTLGYMVAKTAYSDHLNEYDEATALRPVYTNYRAGNGIQEHQVYYGRSVDEGKKMNQCVLIRNNDIMLPTAPMIELYAMRLTDLQRAIDINVNAMKTPVLIKGSEKQRLSLKQVFSQWNGFEPVIFGDKTLDQKEIEALRIDAPVYFDKLQLQKHALWNECMTALGINNANMDKKERLVNDEVKANDEQIAASATIMLKARQKACELINSLYGLNVSVDYRESIKEKMVQFDPAIADPSESFGGGQ